ncbi:MAG: ACP S-malonyltransferase [Vitreimonas sp.]
MAALVTVVGPTPFRYAALMTIAFIFPGQGAQTPGMGKSLHDAFGSAREVFQEIDEALGEKLSRLIFEGPADELTLTANTQPALMAVSLAAMRALEREFGVSSSKALYVAGHSLGEYSALAAAGALSISDTAKLLRARGNAMQAAVPVGEGAMAALIGKVDVATAEAIATEGAAAGIVVVANDNNAGNVVISGDKAGVDAALAAAKAKGVRAIPLKVSAPFHSPLMQPAADVMAGALATTEIAPLAVPLVANVTARPINEPATIRRLLVEQVTGRVRWRESVEWMAGEGGVARFVEVGAGNQLSGMVKRNAPDAEALALNEPADLEAFAKTV